MKPLITLVVALLFAFSLIVYAMQGDTDNMDTNNAVSINIDTATGNICYAQSGVICYTPQGINVDIDTNNALAD